jgi:hypothetical protein
MGRISPSTLKMEGARSFKTLARTSAMNCQIPEDYILKNHQCATTEDLCYTYTQHGTQMLTAESEIIKFK